MFIEEDQLGAGLLTTGLQSCCLVVSLSRGLTPSSAFVDEAARLRGIMRKIVEGVLEIRSLKLRGDWEHGAGSRERGRGQERRQRAKSKEQRAKSKEQGQGARNAARFGSRLSVLGYQVDKGEQKYRTSGRRTRRAVVIRHGESVLWRIGY